MASSVDGVFPCVLGGEDERARPPRGQDHEQQKDEKALAQHRGSRREPNGKPRGVRTSGVFNTLHSGIFIKISRSIDFSGKALNPSRFS
jgi:hypothetical protein